jgi:hypothetical protein
MTCHTCTQAAKAVDYALDDEELHRSLAALRTFDDCATLIEQLHVSELKHYGPYAACEDLTGMYH